MAAEAKMSVPFVTSAALDVPHGFLGREGGVSTGAMASLQCGLGADDDSAAIRENRARAAHAVLPGAALASVRQVHGIHTVTVTGPIADDAREAADALVTDRPGILLGILTADCAPVLLADRAAGVVGAAHAGWKGALGGVCASVVTAMVRLGADRDNIAAAVGPCIARASYEVDERFFARFTDQDAAHERFFSAGAPGHHQFDLEAFVGAQLAEAGIRHVELLGEDTYAQPDRYYSYRRATHRGEPDYGRQIALIGLDA